MAEDSNLVARLREAAKHSVAPSAINQVLAAADEIERLRADFARVVIANAEVAKLNAEQAETIERLRGALKELLDDEWRCTVDWGPRDERQAILDRCSALVGTVAEPNPLPYRIGKGTK